VFAYDDNATVYYLAGTSGWGPTFGGRPTQVWNLNPVAPAITSQPVSRTNVSGTTATFTVAATGTAPLTYEWRFNGANLANGGAISGVTTTNLTIASAQTNHAGNYTVVVSNAYGSVTSAVATLVVTVAPVFASSGADASTVPFWHCAAGTNRFYDGFGTYAAANYSDSYNTETLLGVNCLKRISSPSSVGVDPVKHHDVYWMARDVSGKIWVFKYQRDGTTYFQAASLGELLPLEEVTLEARLMYGTYAVGTAFTNGDYVTQIISTNATLPEYPGFEFVAFQETEQSTGYYDLLYYHELVGMVMKRVLVNQGTSRGWKVRGFGGTAPVILTQPYNLTLPPGTNATFRVIAAGIQPSYQWRKNGGSVAGATESRFTLTNLLVSHGGDYSVVVTNAYGSATSRVATLSVDANALVLPSPHLPGYNMIPVPFGGSGLTNAELLAQTVAGCTGVWRWDATTQSWSGHPKGGPNNFSLVTGGVYLISTTLADSYLLSGVQTSFIQTLKRGYNLVCVPSAQAAAVTNAESLAVSVPNCTGVWKWTAATQSWSGHPKGGPNNFVVEVGTAYLVSVTADGNW